MGLFSQDKPEKPDPPVIMPPNIDKKSLLLSTQIYELVDLICEGPIAGFIDENGVVVEGENIAKAIYLNDAPIQNTDNGSFNFQKFAFDARLGEEKQVPLSIPSDIDKEQTYREPLIGPWDWSSNDTVDNRSIKKGSISYGRWGSTGLDGSNIEASDAISVYHVIENNFVNRITVNFLVEALFDTVHTHKDANKVGTKLTTKVNLEIKIWLKSPTGAKTLKNTVPVEIKGLVESPYGFSKEIVLPDREEGYSIIVEVKRTTPETVSPLLKRKVILDSVIDTVANLEMNHPLSAVVGLKIDARTFSQPPQRTFNIRGKLIRIPSNYYPLQTEETPEIIWDVDGSTGDWWAASRGFSVGVDLGGSTGCGGTVVTGAKITGSLFMPYGSILRIAPSGLGPSKVNNYPTNPPEETIRASGAEIDILINNSIYEYANSIQSFTSDLPSGCNNAGAVTWRSNGSGAYADFYVPGGTTTFVLNAHGGNSPWGLSHHFAAFNMSVTSRPKKLPTQDLRRYGFDEYAIHTNGIEPVYDMSKYGPARIYDGEWDGKFKMGWTDNPAWILYDLLIDPVYGLGNYIDSRLIDKWTLYEIGRYCDAADDAGYFAGVTTVDGGLEPRYSCNVILEKQSSAFDIINYIAGIFRGMVYWSNGSLHFADDRPKEAVDHFGNANVLNGEFRYSETAKNARYTVAEISYNDKDDNYLPKVEYVEDADGIVLLGIIKNSTQGFGTTSRSEARRIGLYQLLSSRLEPEFCTFTTTSKALYLKPGDVISISDELRQINKANGITQKYTYNAAANYLEILLDSQVPSGEYSHIGLTSPWEMEDIFDLDEEAENEGGVSRTSIMDMRAKQFASFPISYISPDRRRIRVTGSYEYYNGEVPTSGDNIAAGSPIPYSKKTVSGSYQDFPEYSLYTLSGSGLAPSLYRIVSIAEENTSSYTVTATQFEDRKFELIEDENALVDLNPNDGATPVFDFLKRPNTVRNINVETGNLIGAWFDMELSFDEPITPPPLSMGPSMGEPEPYRISVMFPDGTNGVYNTSYTGLVITGLNQGGNYNFSITSVGASPNFLQSNAATKSFFVFPANPPYTQPIVTGFNFPDAVSQVYGSTTGTITLGEDFDFTWKVRTPDGALISGVDVANSPYKLSQHIRFFYDDIYEQLDMEITGYKSTRINKTWSELQSGFHGLPLDDIKIIIDVSGELAPNTSPTSYTLKVLKPTPRFLSGHLQHGLGTDNYDSPTGPPTQLNTDTISGEMVVTLYPEGSGWQDLQFVRVLTGSSPIYWTTLEDDWAGNFHEDVFFNGDTSGSLQIRLQGFEQEVTDDSDITTTVPLYNPVYLKFVPHDSVGGVVGGEQFDMTGQWASPPVILTPDDVVNLTALDMETYYETDNAMQGDEILAVTSMQIMASKRITYYDGFERQFESDYYWNIGGGIATQRPVASGHEGRRGLKFFSPHSAFINAIGYYIEFCHPNSSGASGSFNFTGKNETLMTSLFFSHSFGNRAWFFGLKPSGGHVTGNHQKFGMVMSDHAGDKNIYITGKGTTTFKINTNIAPNDMATVKWTFRIDYSGDKSQSGRFQIWSGNSGVYNENHAFSVGSLTGVGAIPMFMTQALATASDPGVIMDDLYMAEDNHYQWS